MSSWAVARRARTSPGTWRWAGRRTAVIERALIGGSCPNIACLPSKNVIHSAKVAELVHRAEAFGQRTGPSTTDMKVVRQRKWAMVAGEVAFHRTKFAAEGLEFVLGEGRFVAPRTIEVRLAEGGTRRIEGERIFLDVGTQGVRAGIPWPGRGSAADTCRGARARPACFVAIVAAFAVARASAAHPREEPQDGLVQHGRCARTSQMSP